MTEPSVRSTLTHMHILCIYKYLCVHVSSNNILHRCGLTPFLFLQDLLYRWMHDLLVLGFDPHIPNLSWYCVLCGQYVK